MTWLLMQSQQMIAATTIGAITAGVVSVWLIIRIAIVIGAGEALAELFGAIVDGIAGGL